MTETDDLSGRKIKLFMGGLSLAGVILPGLQRFYLGQRSWGIAFVVIGGLILLPFTPLKFLSYLLRLVCLVEGIWVLSMDNSEFDARFNPEQQKLDWTTASKRKSTLPEAQLQQALQQGIITQSEYTQQLRKVQDPEA